MWKLCTWKPGQTRPDIAEVYVSQDIGGDLQIAIDSGCTRVEAIRKGHPVDPLKPVKVRKIEWTQEEHSKGEHWVGRVNGKVVASVVHLSEAWGGRCFYSLSLGELDNSGGKAANVESGKRAAQSAFTKFVHSLVDG